MREEARADKSDGGDKLGPAKAKPKADQPAAAVGRRMTNAPAPPATTKRQKSG